MMSDPTAPGNGENAIPAEDDTALPEELLDGSPVDAVLLLIEEAKTTAASEIALLKACAALSKHAVKRLTFWSILALFCALVGLLAFAIGAMIAIAQWTDPVWAAVIVPGLLFLVAAISGLFARNNARVLRKVLKVYQQ